MPQNVNSNDVLVRDEELKIYIKSLFGNAPIKKLTGQNVQVNVNDIVAHKSNNTTITYYKVIKQGTIKIPDVNYCQKLTVQSSNISVTELKKKLTDTI